MATAPILRHPIPNQPFILDTDASNFAAGGVLSQNVDGVEKVVAFASKTFNPAQANYCTTHRELLAVVEMTKRFRHYLLGRQFLLRTDHSSLRWLLNYKNADGMLARWLVKLQEFDMIIQHRAGKSHGNADGLSRCHSCPNPRCPGKPRPDPESEQSDDSLFDPPGCADDPRRPQTPVERPRQVFLDQDETNPPQVHSVVEQVALSAKARKRKTKRRSTGRPRPASHPDATHTNAKMPADTPRLVNVNADGPNRVLDTTTWLQNVTKQDIKNLQRSDPTLLPVILALECNTKPTSADKRTMSSDTLTLVARWKQLVLLDGVMYRRYQLPRTTAPILQLVVPNTLRTQILHQLHGQRLSGHLGVQRTCTRVQRRFYWPGWSNDVERWLAACPQCAARKPKPGPTRHPMVSISSGSPFDRIGMDILDTRIRSKSGHNYILVISDYFTKWTDAFPLKRHTAHDVAHVLMTRFIVYFGVPKIIHSDQGREFESQLIRSLATLLGCSKSRTSPYHPRCDGMVERANRSLLQMLSTYVSKTASDWDEHLPYVMSAYRSSPHASTNCTPYAMVFGREMNLPVDLMYPTAVETSCTPKCGPEYVDWIRQAIASAHQHARSSLDKSAIRQKLGYDAHSKRRPTLKPGDKVRYYYPPAKQGNKMASPWLGPFTVLDQVTDVDYRIRSDLRRERVLVTHIDNLKPWEGELSLDIDIQTRQVDDLPLPEDLSAPRNSDEEIQYLLGIPVPDDDSPSDSVYSDEGSDGEQPLPKRQRKPPKRYGWD